MVEVLEVVQNDELYDINFTVYDYARVVVNLTNVTEIKLRSAIIGGTVLDLDVTCSVVSAVDGTCKYTVQNGELITIGLYHAELQITYSGGKIITTKRFDIRVVKDLP